jgi:hypothetical protein
MGQHYSLRSIRYQGLHLATIQILTPIMPTQALCIAVLHYQEFCQRVLQSSTSSVMQSDDQSNTNVVENKSPQSINKSRRSSELRGSRAVECSALSEPKYDSPSIGYKMKNRAQDMQSVRLC